MLNMPLMLTSPFDEGLGGDRAAAGAGPRRRQAEEGREEKGKLIEIFLCFNLIDGPSNEYNFVFPSYILCGYFSFSQNKIF